MRRDRSAAQAQIVRRGPLAGASAVAAACLLAGALAVRAIGPSVSPPLPAQPGSTVADPVCRAMAPKTWAVLHAEYDSPFELRIDPMHPCVEYIIRSNQDLARSVDKGASWTPVFHDASATCPVPGVACLPQFAAGSLESPGSGLVGIGEVANGNAVVLSTDHGATWSIANGGLSDLDGKQVISLTHATPDGKQILAIARLAAQAVADLIYWSLDGGTTWNLSRLPPGMTVGGDPLVAVDPADPTHMWLMVPQAGGAAAPLLLETNNAGADWQNPITGSLSLPSTSGFVPTGFLALRSERHLMRLVATLRGSATPGANLVFSDNDGITWANAAAALDVGGLGVAADPADNDRMVYVGLASLPVGGTTLSLSYSTDGFDTAAPLTAPVLVPFVAPATPLQVSPVTVQADAYGGFYVLAATACGAVSGVCPSGAKTAQAVYYMTPQITSVPSPGGGGSGGGGGRGGLPPSIPMQQVGFCPTVGHRGGSLGASGAVAYDGVDLLYTETNERGPTPLQSVVHRMDPVTCADAGDIVVTFTRQQVDSANSCAASGNNGLPARIDDLTYDANRDELWVTLQANDGALATLPRGSCALRVTLSDMTGHNPTGVARLDWLNGCGGGTLAYDQFNDTIWTCDNANRTQDPTVSGGHISALTGKGFGLLACIPSVGFSGPYAGTLLKGTSTWVVGAPHRIYLEAEDDRTVIQFDSVNCNPLAYYSHDQYSEASGEQEQMACDGNTFGPTKGPVLWLRDAGNLSINAYRIPDGYCPLPTQIRYAGPAHVQVGEKVDLCGTLRSFPRGLPLAGMPLSFVFDGVVEATATTRADGTGCATMVADRPSGQYPVRSLFAGVSGFFGSQDDGVLKLLDAPVVPIPPPAIIPAVVVPPPPPPPPPNPIPPVQPAPPPAQLPVSQPQPITQAQAQVQAQAATSTQEQEQLQVAVAMDGSLQPAESYAMTALGGLLLVPLMWFGVRAIVPRRSPRVRRSFAARPTRSIP